MNENYPAKSAGYNQGDWVASFNFSKVYVGEELGDLNVGGGALPNADVSIGNDTTLTFDIAYFVSSNIAVDFFVGVPARAKFQGEKSISSLGRVSEVDYGPAILSLQYHYDSFERLYPYVGVGVGRVLFFDKTDGALSSFDIKDKWAPAFQVGLRYDLGNSWMLNSDVRYIPFKTDVTGTLGPVPVSTKIEVDPFILSLGASYVFKLAAALEHHHHHHHH
uniref:Outer membrane protein AlkL n=1 Tax=Ectopseudomonas oleovorans TaxID=301 RepID=UPI00132CDA0F|nr:Chain A, Outer membrane protein AlkL [Pseudomonas oleovorans]6QWR_A Chain A, Outer membrane protein AlkL [Pseudomonas oleovorans]